ncbi:MAG TPA: deoxyribonuclease IV [Candidatus Baltobacteraceae bacterium]
MRFGLHVPIKDGYDATVQYAARLGCTALQIFSNNPQSYRRVPIDLPVLAAFAQKRAQAGLDPCVIHTPYLINLASDDRKKLHGSMGLLEHDLHVAGAARIRYVNTHLGSYGTRPRTEAFPAVVQALERVLATIPPDVMLVMENSAGAGQLVGGTVEELGEFLRAVDHPQLGVCIDTAHSWAAGYEINSPDGVERFIDLIAQHVGLDRLHLFHFNDTQIPLGGHKDRHWHIGEGNIGFEGFRALAAHPELREKTAILETPGEEADDIRNLQTIRSIFEGAAVS